MKQYENEKAAMKERMKASPISLDICRCLTVNTKAAPGRVSSTIDCWSSGPMDSYIGITGHYITTDAEGWHLEEELLGFKALHGPHSGENLAEYAVEVFVELGVIHKVSELKDFIQVQLNTIK